MATYDTYEVEPRKHKHRHHDRKPSYVETKETYVRGVPGALSPDAAYAPRNGELVRQPQRQDSDMSIEEVRRDFPPPGAGTYAAQRSVVRARSSDRYGDYYDDPRRRSYNDAPRRSRNETAIVEEKRIDARPQSLTRNQKIMAAAGGAALALGGKEVWDRRAAAQMDGERAPRNAMASAAIGAAGAFAGYEGAELYAKHRPKFGGEKEKEKASTYVAKRDKNGKVAEYYSSDSDAPRKSKKGRRADSDDELITTKKKTKKSGEKGKKDEPETGAKVQQAAKAALLAGAYEAFRVRNEPGAWQGEKGKRILTAAIGAGGIDAAADRKPNEHSKRHILEAVVGGLAGNRLINGSRKEVVEDEETGRSTSRARSRSRARSQSHGPGSSGGNGGPGGGGLGALAAAGLAGLAGSKLLNRSKSRGRHDSSDDDYSSDDSRARPSGSRKRSKSVSDYARKGLAALGLGEAAKGSEDRVEEETHVYRKRRGGGGSDRPYAEDRYADSRSSVGGRSARQNGQARRAAEESDSDSSDLGSSSGDERHIKKMKGKQLLTAGLATIATIHAAHNIYQSMEKRDARHKAVAEGEMTPEEARKLKAKATLQDAASVGIAALGIKGAISEIKEANELRHECREFNEKKAERHRRRMERIRGQMNGSEAGGYGRRRIDGPPEDEYGPRSADANPYAAGRLPAPPMDYEYDRR